MALAEEEEERQRRAGTTAYVDFGQQYTRDVEASLGLLSSSSTRGKRARQWEAREEQTQLAWGPLSPPKKGKRKKGVANIAWYSTTWNFDSARQESLRTLAEGRNPNHWLQQIFNTHGLRDIRFEIVETIPWPTKPVMTSSLKNRSWGLKGEKRKRIRLDQFREVLNARCNVHHQTFLRLRLSQTLSIWRKKQMMPKWGHWKRQARFTTVYRRLLACLTIQRGLRGKKGRRRARRRRRWVSARHLQRTFRYVACR